MKFEVYIKSEKFYWTNNKVIYSIIFFCFVVVLINNGTGIIIKNFVNNIFMSIVGLAFVAGFILKIFGYTQIEPLRGKLDGYLIFNKNFVQVQDKVFPIETISKIKISNDDYYRKITRIAGGNFGPALSNGTNNFLVIFFESYETKQFQFQMRNSDDFQEIRETLIDYHLKGKIEFWELAQVLGENSTSETLALTEEIKKRDTNSNTC